MDNEFYIITGLVVAYFIGSIPTSVWIGKKFYGIDVREHGSGNAGATNTFRILGTKAGVIVFILDLLKGVGVIAFASIFINYFNSAEYFVVFQLFSGLMAILGHMFPAFANFHGGKGVATLSGIVLSIFPLVFLVCLGVFILVFLPTRYVSLSSILAAITFPVFVIFVFETELVSKSIFAILAASVIIVSHRKNILRLINGTEKKI